MSDKFNIGVGRMPSEGAMGDVLKRGDYPYIDAQVDEHGDEERLPEKVFAAELADINARRKRNNKTEYDPRSCQPTGVALSGGGIRSASFCLGALQGLQSHPKFGMEDIDYLSTVSGGGYVGCALIAATQNLDGQFPFTSSDSKVYADTPSVRHIRDYSNYLIPHGAGDVITALTIVGRGLAANALIVLPILLFFVGLTLFIHPDAASLEHPSLLNWNVAEAAAALGVQGSPPLWGLHGFWFTAILAVVGILFLAIWAIAKSVAATHFWQTTVGGSSTAEHSAELSGGLVTFSKILFLITLTSLWFETQPFILSAMDAMHSNNASVCADWTFSGACLGRVLNDWFSRLTPFLASFGAAFALLSKYFGDVIALAKSATGWTAQLKKMTATAALWFAAIVVPSCLWLVYLNLAYWGLGKHWTPSFFVASGMTLFLALFIDPNVTSLYRLYRDRLSKAFLFNPDPKKPRDTDHDLPAYEPKLSELNTLVCPYPIINAALNIEGSRYANKRGREADFFIFTPEYTGSRATGYIGTRRIEDKETALDLATAMAISGAALSSNMGVETIKPLAFTLALLNIRLGYWLHNPMKISGKRTWLEHVKDIRVLSLFMEMFSRLDERNHLIYLTDGGHIENLGVYSLLKRRCKLIIAIDAESDPRMGFGALLTLERYARIDLGAIIELPWEAIRDCALATNVAFDKARADASSVPSTLGPHCAAGAIQYGGKDKGILLYVKASVSGDEGDYILDYKRRYSTFPHETTGDQFFGEEQLEAYRALGFHIMRGLMTGSTPFALIPHHEETEDQARQRIWREINAALLGVPRDTL
jgi:hypothetical protein